MLAPCCDENRAGPERDSQQEEVERIAKRRIACREVEAAEWSDLLSKRNGEFVLGTTKCHSEPQCLEQFWGRVHCAPPGCTHELGDVVSKSKAPPADCAPNGLLIAVGRLRDCGRRLGHGVPRGRALGAHIRRRNLIIRPHRLIYGRGGRASFQGSGPQRSHLRR